MAQVAAMELQVIHKTKRPPATALTDAQAKEAIRLHLHGMNFRELSERTGYPLQTLYGICTGKSRSHLLMQVEREPKGMMG